MQKLLSLCIPTNGVVEWVRPVLDNIFSQGINEELYEVVVCDNGNDLKFEQMLREYETVHNNLVYKKTTAYQFYNQIEAFKIASGEFIKFVNHRAIFEKGSIEHILECIKKNIVEKPVMYFLNGQLHNKEGIITCDNFEAFVRKLSYFSSWSAGLGVWKSDFEKMPDNIEYNRFFPHISVLFYETGKKKYLIDNSNLFHELPTDNTKKGRYRLFQAFAIEYPSILLDLSRRNLITIETFLLIRNELRDFIATQYMVHVLKKEPCSYDLSNSNQELEVFFSKKEIMYTILRKRIGRLLRMH